MRRLGLPLPVAASFLLTVAAGATDLPAPPPVPSVDATVSVRSRVHLAERLERERRYEEALELYREVVDSVPGEPRALRGVKTCLLELKRHDELVTLLQEELAGSPNDPAVLGQLGTALVQSGDREGAVRAWRRILDVQKGSRGAYSMVADHLKASRLLDEALAVYTEADSLHPNVFTRQKAELQELRFDFAAATAEYLRFLELNPTSLSYVEGRLLRIGEAEEGLGPVIERVERRMLERTAEAAGEALRSAAGTAGDLVFRKLVGDLYLEAGRHAEAGEQYFRLAEQAPGQFSSLLVFAKRCQTDGQHDVAIRMFERLLDESSDARIVAGALTEIGRSQAELERWDDALATYARLVDEYPETDWALAARLERGRILRDGKRDADAAEQEFRGLIPRGAGPWGEADPQFEVAECAVWRGDLARAEGIYHSIQQRPFAESTRERAMYEEARAMFHQGKLGPADSLFRAVAQTYPKGLHVNDALEYSILINTNRGEEEPLARYGEALLDLRTRDPAAAVAKLEQLVAEHAGAAIVDESLLLLGRAEREAGQPDRALAALDRAVAEAQVMDLAAAARLLRARILAEDKNDRPAALAEYEELLVTYPETLAADRARDLAGDLKRVLP